MSKLPGSEGLIFSSAVFLRLCLLRDCLLVCDDSLHNVARELSSWSSRFFGISPTLCNCNSYRTLGSNTNILHAFQV